MSAGAADATEARRLVDLAIDAEASGAGDEALRLYGQAAALDPAYPAPHFNIGLACIAKADWGPAEEAMRTALRLRPGFPEALAALAEVLEHTGREGEALGALDAAIEQQADFAGALFNRSALLRRMGNVVAAGKALALFAQVQAGHAAAMLERGHAAEAIPLLFDALEVDGANARWRQQLAGALYGAAFGAAGERERSILASLCQDDDISTVFLATAIASVLKADPAFHALLEAVARDADPYGLPGTGGFVGSPLLLAALPRMPIIDADLEAVLTFLRRWTLVRALPAPAPAQDGSLPECIPTGFVYALGRQCFLCGYALFVTPQEQHAGEAIQAALKAQLDDGAEPAALADTLAIHALYAPVAALDADDYFIEHGLEVWPTAFRPIVAEQVLDRQREAGLAAAMPALTPIDDSVSRAVRMQYEESPYPRWVSVPRPERDSFAALAQRLCPERPTPRPNGPARILVAGCGTGHHSLQVARAFPDSEILAVDLSLASLAYAERMTARFGVTNIRFAQADLLGLGVLAERFAIIECAGVLHHIEDPVRGWRVLSGLLEPDGLMRVALYSETARAGVRAAREQLSVLGLPPTPAGIRAARHAIMALPHGDPAREVLAFGDFFTLNGCRDLLMHVQEHVFTLPRIAECLAALGLRFVQMECPPRTWAAFRGMFGAADAARDLAAWHRFEAAHPRTFSSMYQFWCVRQA